VANLRAARRNLYAIAAILIVVDIIAIVILFSSPAAAGSARQEEFNQLRQQVQAKSRVVVPPEQVQQRVEETRKQIGEFLQQRVPEQSSELSIELGKLASAAGVHLGSVHYGELESDVAGLRRFQVSATIAGDYLQAVKFINSLERSKNFFVINNVNLGEQQPGTVRLGLTLDTYLKEAQ
jgi:Tfp pilus assembly protein PilO